MVPVKSEYRAGIRGIVHDTSGSGQTIFVEPEDVLQLGNSLRELEAAEREEVRRILAELSSKVGKNAAPIEAGIDSAGEMDFLLSKSRLAFEIKVLRRKGGRGKELRFREGVIRCWILRLRSRSIFQLASTLRDC